MATITGSYSNYGSVFQYPSGTAYAALVVDYPEYTDTLAEITNNQSGGLQQFIYTGLQKASPFTISLLGQPGIYETFKGYQTSKSKNCAVLSDSVEIETFNGLISNVKKEPSDQQNPDAVKITVTVQKSL